MGAIDESKLNNILPKYDELKLSGKNLAQQYVSAFNTGMNIYQCINQLQGYIEWVIKAVNDVVVQWNDIIDKQIKYAIDKSVDESVKTSINASKQATTEQFNVEWEKVQPTLNTTVENLVDTRLDAFMQISKIGVTEDYYFLTESKDKSIKKLDDYIRYNQPYTKGAPYYSVTQLIRGFDLSGYTLKTAVLKNNIFKLTDSSGELIDYVYLDLNNVTVSGGTYGDSPYTKIETKFTPAVTKFTGKEEANGNLAVNTCVTLILEKTSS